MPDFVRVRDKGTGHVSSIARVRAERLGDAVELLDEPAVDGLGRPLPAAPAPKPTKTAPAAKTKEQTR